MTGKKAVLNITVDESLASAVRGEAAARKTTISSVVEEALAAQLERFRLRHEGLAAIEEYYREYGYPTPEEVAEADARVAEDERLIAEARERARSRGTGSAA
ncbi:MAG TPA: hypothetical protein VGI64_03590 [Streptosporangiaceae bacterium]